jgi:uncharacterized protein (TIRG00374 family)
MKIPDKNFNILRRNFFPLLSLLFGIILLFLLFFFIKPASILASLEKIAFWQFGLIFGLKLVFWTLSALKWKIILDFYQQKVSLWKLYLFKFATFSVSYFTPITAVGGQAVGVLLLKNEKVPVKTGITTMLIDSLLTPFVSVTISLFAIVLFLLTRFSSASFLTLALITFFSVVLFLTLFFIVFRISRRTPEKIKPKAWPKWKITLKDYLFIFSDFFRKNKKGTLYLVVLSFLSHVSILFEIFLILYFLGITLDVIELAIIEAGYIFAFVIPVSQALGTAEASGAYILQALGYSVALGISLTLILRLRHLLIGLIGVVVLIFYGLIRLVYRNPNEGGRAIHLLKE